MEGLPLPNLNNYIVSLSLSLLATNARESRTLTKPCIVINIHSYDRFAKAQRLTKSLVSPDIMHSSDHLKTKLLRNSGDNKFDPMSNDQYSIEIS